MGKSLASFLQIVPGKPLTYVCARNMTTSDQAEAEGWGVEVVSG